MIKPASAPAAMSTGSGILKRHATTSAAAKVELASEAPAGSIEIGAVTIRNSSNSSIGRF